MKSIGRALMSRINSENPANCRSKRLSGNHRKTVKHRFTPRERPRVLARRSIITARGAFSARHGVRSHLAVLEVLPHGIAQCRIVARKAVEEWEEPQGKERRVGNYSDPCLGSASQLFAMHITMQSAHNLWPARSSGIVQDSAYSTTAEG